MANYVAMDGPPGPSTAIDYIDSGYGVYIIYGTAAIDGPPGPSVAP